MFYIVLDRQKQGSDIIFCFNCFNMACRDAVAQRTMYGNKGDLPRYVRQFVPGVPSSVDPIVDTGPY